MQVDEPYLVTRSAKVEKSVAVVVETIKDKKESSLKPERAGPTTAGSQEIDSQGLKRWFRG